MVKTGSKPGAGPRWKPGRVLADRPPPLVFWHHPGWETTTMSAPPTDSGSLEERLSALEAENRDLQGRVSQPRFLAAMLGVGLLLYSAFHAAFATPI
jgi:hypothetical protein